MKCYNYSKLIFFSILDLFFYSSFCWFLFTLMHFFSFMFYVCIVFRVCFFGTWSSLKSEVKTIDDFHLFRKTIKGLCWSKFWFFFISVLQCWLFYRHVNFSAILCLLATIRLLRKANALQFSLQSTRFSAVFGAAGKWFHIAAIKKR